MSKIRQCYQCSTMLATERKKKAWLQRSGEKGRSVEVCRTCWWKLIGGGMQATGKGRHRETLCVSIKQRELFDKEGKPTAGIGGKHG